MNDEKKGILLHVCCATCAAGSYERLKALGFKNIMFFEFNPNIFPSEEHDRRTKDIRKLCSLKEVPFHTAPCDHETWLKKVSSLKDEPEGGQRCSLCYRIRLEETAKKAAEIGVPFFACTLSISPHKDTRKINSIAEEIAGKCGVLFFPEDFKKKDGFKRSLQLSRELEFYRQNYCGCEFSMRKA
jgi:predicted adenine nucleotide alpha hydrolase (AANH) superfamily ATPase